MRNVSPTITNFSIPTKTFGDDPFVITDPSSNSSGTFSYSSSNTLVATISGNTITIVGGGTSIITATQEETTNYYSLPIVTELNVERIHPTITFSMPTKTFADISFIPEPSSNSPGGFYYSSSNTSVATIYGNTIKIVGVGSSTILLVQENTNIFFHAVLEAELIVTKSIPTIDFYIPAKTLVDDNPFEIPEPSSNSSGSFSY